MSINTSKTEADKFIESLFISFFGLIKWLFVSLFRGIKKLGNKNILITFLLLILISLCIYYFRDVISLLPYPDIPKKIVFYFVLALPIFFLIILGSFAKNETSDYDQIFESIAFKGRNGKYPFFCSLKTEGKKQTYIFKSNIPLNEWRKNKDFLETAFDCNIINMNSGKSKNVVIMATVPADCVIPEYITWKDQYRCAKEGEICLGVSYLQKVTFNLNSSPHSLFAGETGSGKSVLLRCCLWQMVNQGARVIMIDFKGGVEFGRQYERYGEVITKRERALEVLDCLISEHEARLAAFREYDVKNLPGYNRKTGDNLCRIGVFCDEIAEMLDKKGASKADRVILEQLDGRLSSIARLSRATGIHLILGTQRPDANVITGQLKTNVTTRVSGRFADKYAYEIILGTAATFELPEIKGRFIFKLGADLIQFQSYYFDDDTVRDISTPPGSVLTDNITSFFPSAKQTKPTQVGSTPIHEPLSSSNNPKLDNWSAEIDKLEDTKFDFNY